jgi:peptidoglycan/LPS O-acetylase OafA/YrhL
MQLSPALENAAAGHRALVVAGAVLPGVQALRGLAAFAVDVDHTASEFDRHLQLPGLMSDFGYGSAGVDLFFVISGFVMVYSSERLFGSAGSLRTFLMRRLVRIVPLYWLMTTVMLAYVLARGFAASDASPMLALASYFFIPYQRPSGVIDPLYGVGWTLNYEMMFYVVFGCTLAVRRELAVAMTSLCLIAFTLSRSVVALPAQLHHLSDPIILEFVYGMLVALVFRAGVKLPRKVAFALIVFAAVLPFVFLATIPATPRWVVWGIPSALLVAAVTLVGRGIAVPAFAVALGNASYALYLIHAATLVVVRQAAWRGFFVNPESAPWLYLAGALLVSVAAAFVVWRWIERPMTQTLRRIFEVRRPMLHESGAA